MYSNIDQWLGCLDPTTSYALWQSAAFSAANLVEYVDYGLIQDAFNPEGLPEYEPLVTAFVTIYGFFFTYIEIDEVPVAVWYPTDVARWLTSIPVILPFAPELLGAPCTQQTFP